MNVIDIISLLQRKSRILLTLTLVAVITSGILNLFILDKVYTSTITLMISNQKSEEENISIDYDDIILGEKLVDTYSIIAKSDPVLEMIITELDLDISVKELSEQIIIRNQAEKRLIEITIQDNDPQRALDKANVFLDVFLWEIQDILNVNNVQIINSPKFPLNPTSPNVILNVLISFFAGFISGLIIIYFINYIDNTIGSLKKLENKFKLPILTKIPKGEKIGDQPYIEFITNYFNGELDKYNKTMLITSSMSLQRDNEFLKALSIVIAQLGKNVMVLDCDFNNPELYKSFDVDNTKGLIDFLGDCQKYQVNIKGYTMYQRNMDNICYYKNYVQNTETPNLDIIPAGIVSRDDHKLLLSKKMDNLLEILKMDYDMVLVNGGSISYQIESLVLAQLTDEIIFIESYRESNFNRIERVIEKLGNNSRKIKGFVINQVPSIELKESKWFRSF